MSSEGKVPVTANEPISWQKKTGAFVLLAFGTGLLLSGRTGSYLLKRVAKPGDVSRTAAPARRLKLKDLAVSNDKTLDFFSNKTLSRDSLLDTAPSTSSAPRTLKQFISWGDQDESVKPLPAEDNFNGALYAAKAFGIATAIVITTFAVAGYSIARLMDVHDVSRLTLRFASPAHFTALPRI